jgi:anaerobic selenocysteine-containing dehydrogenase
MNTTSILAELERWTQLKGDGEVQAACPHDCPDTCAMRVKVVDGKAIAVKGDPTHSLTSGTLCTKVSRYTERSYHPGRLTTPLKRIGKKGEGKFAPISWDEAYTTITERLAEVWRRNPEGILPYSYAGTMGQVQGEGMAGRFFHALGASLLERTICASAGSAGLELCMGKGVGMDTEAIRGAKLIVIWGSNPITSHVHLWAQIQQAKREGAILWAIDPYVSDSVEKCHHHIALRPGTDAALAYGIAHILQRDGMLDVDYIDRFTSGAEDFLREAAAWNPQRAASWCDIPIAQIEALAKAYGSTKPAAIRLNYGMQRHASGGDAVRVVMALPALTGQWRHVSGGAVLSTSGWAPKVDPSRADLLGDRTPRSINMSAIGDALLERTHPVEALIVYNSNPVAVAPDSAKVRAGFAREDMFTVVLEHFQTDTADYADIVLPATTQLEHFDIHRAYGHLHILLNRPAIAPLGEARSNSRIFRELTERMRTALGDQCAPLNDSALDASDAKIALEAFDWSSPALEDSVTKTLFAQGHARYAAPAVGVAPFAQGNFKTTDGKFWFSNPNLAEPLPQVRRNHEDWQSPLADKFPLQVISPPARHLLNSSFGNVQSLRALNGDPALWIHPQDAAARGLTNGQLVRVFNDRGSHLAVVEITERARPGVVVAFSIYWHKDSPGGINCNAVTSQKLTDHGAGATFYDCLVEVAAA